MTVKFGKQLKYPSTGDELTISCPGKEPYVAIKEEHGLKEKKKEHGKIIHGYG